MSSSSASRALTSASLGMSRCSMRARPIALSTRSRRTSCAPTGAVWPVVKIRWTTSRTAPTRSASWSGAGTRYGMRAAAIFFLARVIRAAMVAPAPGTRGPPRRWTGRRPAAASARPGHRGTSAGWQQVKTSRRRSSSARPSSGPGIDCSVAPAAAARGAAPTPGAARPAPGCGRSVVSQAPGRSGMPVRGPGLQRLGVRVLGALLRQVEVPGQARRRGEHPGPLATVRLRDRRDDLGAHP